MGLLEIIKRILVGVVGFFIIVWVISTMFTATWWWLFFIGAIALVVVGPGIYQALTRRR